ncbi:MULTISPECIES: phospho-N-acetylmuramoyl-pentapeptide-transferase [unclassified Gemella]|uniref:phospho-N-acetylmuramoyl-pentapeptide- transferase n=1 Tax=unclassified Gemella TaxID=2624949 RepID=UPI0010748DAF|nr:MULTISPECIES: phospho-N-acetylmuramoyl-pentapeptide-transferase [unclassified Gemella]MBF0710016.1 phospho-N-acetylmuramoyl-pentapeptide-transferase [Gemella sp. GL1.1]MBF0746095.1 phospho-N-acetylmuramoyl-pentapeptide-transferase [Gemella sp. 19428wG2_WT2a]NYS27360.1 phospho-N-acetylmuramoyl-pentapeptide-transferase [Gemella sp. GL1]TFU60386.1 phospho-N-acetylmuramoyl-pentapeptide-transferase [Gemella sp. WT2a]
MNLFFILSFILTVLMLPSLIKYLHKLKFGQAIREEGPQSHAAKKGTPTMGGISFILAITISLIIAAIVDKTNAVYYFLFIYTTLSFSLIGYIDDMLIVVKKKNDGLKPRHKLFMQIGFSIIFYILLKLIYVDVDYIDLPLTDVNINLSIVYLLFVVFWQTGFSNAVNLTDGLDGLATSVTIITSLTFALIAYKENNTAVLTFCLIIAGSLVGFLLFNKKPAKIFMGDTGSLALGGMLAAISIILHKEIAFLFIGLVYILETASVMIQVAYFKKTGKRIFKMSPLHHHFELSGYGEVKTVWIFVVIASVSCSIGYLIGVL